MKRFGIIEYDDQESATSAQNLNVDNVIVVENMSDATEPDALYEQARAFGLVLYYNILSSIYFLQEL
jgi:hypothetical protein